MEDALPTGPEETERRTRWIECSYNREVRNFTQLQYWWPDSEMTCDYFETRPRTREAFDGRRKQLFLKVIIFTDTLY